MLQVWALAVSPGDDTVVVTGGADSVINVWDDKTAELEETARQENEERLLLEQDLSNALRNKDFRRAAVRLPARPAAAAAACAAPTSPARLWDDAGKHIHARQLKPRAFETPRA